MIHLDTSFAVDFLRERAAQHVGPATRFVEDVAYDQQIALSVHAHCELLAGAALAARPEAERSLIERLCEEVRLVYPDGRLAPAYAEESSHQERAGRRIPTMDLLIGITALLDHAALVTRDDRHLRQIRGLEILTY